MINKPVGPTFLRPFWLILGCLLLLGSSAQDHRFDIWKGKDIVGSILVKRKVDGGRTHYVMSSFSEFDILWKQQVRSLVSTEYMNGGVSKCYSHVKVNGNVRDSSHFHLNRDSATCYVHPDEHFVHEGLVEWTTARMYYEEPVGQQSVFVESVLRHCRLQHTGPGTYRLHFPDGKVNNYTYRNGRLEEVHVDRNFFELVFRRDG
ncbi:MAG: hypothetical protein KDB95_03045 [Flavobacteriales bacterium]|nr:hypothetical protein [Flavobacteriales bacterium]